MAVDETRKSVLQALDTARQAVRRIEDQQRTHIQADRLGDITNPDHYLSLGRAEGLEMAGTVIDDMIARRGADYRVALQQVIAELDDLTMTICVLNHGPNKHARDENATSPETITAFHDGQYRMLNEMRTRVKFMLDGSERLQ